MARTKTTFEKEMEDNGFKQKFEKEYKRFSLSETVLELMKKKKMSVRKLAKEAQLSPTIIQELRSGGRKQLAFATALQIINALDCKLEVVDGKNHIPLVKT
ncbi:MAG: helix-turn-helix domain-containing protein [Candidatus Scalindua sp.]|jgi:DNA-binding Xre family transcriptional regulator